MSKLSYDHTDLVALLRVVDEIGPISTHEMVRDFIEPTKRGLIAPDGRLTEKGKKMLAAEDGKP